jgi:hypothetical protein
MVANVTVVLAVAALLSAIASVVAAAIAYTSNQRAIQPSIWFAARGHDEGEARVIQVRVHNGGPGLARDVVAARSEPTGNPEKPNEWLEHDHTGAIRTLQGGESMPPTDGDWLSVGTDPTRDGVLAVVVRYTDLRGVRHEVSTPLDPCELSKRPTKLRRYRWQWWREKADW